MLFAFQSERMVQNYALRVLSKVLIGVFDKRIDVFIGQNYLNLLSCGYGMCSAEYGNIADDFFPFYFGDRRINDKFRTDGSGLYMLDFDQSTDSVFVWLEVWLYSTSCGDFREITEGVRGADFVDSFAFEHGGHVLCDGKSNRADGRVYIIVHSKCREKIDGRKTVIAGRKDGNIRDKIRSMIILGVISGNFAKNNRQRNDYASELLYIRMQAELCRERGVAPQI